MCVFAQIATSRVTVILCLEWVLNKSRGNCVAHPIAGVCSEVLSPGWKSVLSHFHNDLALSACLPSHQHISWRWNVKRILWKWLNTISMKELRYAEHPRTSVLVYALSLSTSFSRVHSVGFSCCFFFSWFSLAFSQMLSIFRCVCLTTCVSTDSVNDMMTAECE